MFRALFAHPQEVLHSGTWYIACVWSGNSIPGAVKWQHARNIASAAYVSPPEDEQVVL
jgi:hypothetical protein